MLVAAAEEHIPDQLRDHSSAGLDAATAARLAACSFASRTLYDPDTCHLAHRRDRRRARPRHRRRLHAHADRQHIVPSATPGRSSARPCGPARRPRRRSRASNAGNAPGPRGHAPSLQAIYDGLRELGYLPHTPAARHPGSQQTRYLRWTDPARGGPAVIYLETGSLCFVRTEDLTALADLSAGTTTLGGRHHNARFPISPQTTDQILLAPHRGETAKRGGPAAGC
jgi:hypothetical protein